MRNTMLFAFLVLGAGAAAQQNKTYTINSIKENKEELIRDAHRYPQFRHGTVMYTDGVATEARLNYHRVFDQVLFISPKGDTLALARPEVYTYVAIGTDTFYVHDKGYLERLTHYDGVNLARKDAIVFVGYQKKGLYDTYSSTMSAESYGSFSNDNGNITQKVLVDQNAVYKTKTRYFLSDEYNNFFPATKKNFYNLFYRQEKKLRDYLQHNDVNFAREQDLLQLLAHLQGS